MADTKIGDATLIDVIAGGDELAVADASAATAIVACTVDQLATYIAPAASDTVAGKIEIAIQSEQETGTSTTLAVTPGRQHFHPSAAKFWVKATGNSTTIEVSYNMDSWADTAPGIADGTITTDFSTVDWCGQVAILGAASNWNTTNTSGCGFSTQAAGTFTVTASQMTEGGTAAANPLDPVAWFVEGFGDHA